MSEAGESSKQQREANAILKQINTRSEQVTTGHAKLQRGSIRPQQDHGPHSAVLKQIAILQNQRITDSQTSQSQFQSSSVKNDNHIIISV